MPKGLDLLIEEIRKRISPHRMSHTMGVLKTADWLGRCLLPDRVYDLSCAALLHDIAKELSLQEQLELIKDAGIRLSDEDLSCEAALHSFAGAALAEREFAEYVNDDIFSAIYNHTLGDAEMSLFDKIIFLSDYIEEGRTNSSSIAVRRFVETSLSDNRENNIAVLCRAIIMSIGYTEEYLSHSGKLINSRSVLLRKELEKIF